MSAEAEPLEDVEFPLGDYRVLQLLGRGGIGEVFVAQRRGSPHLCALKRLRPDVRAVGAAHARIRREAHLATFLHHPNVCQVLDAGVEDGNFFLASEFVAGVDLERIIQGLAQRRLALAMDMVQAIMLPALAGLAHAHSATDSNGAPLGIVHRDLSPRNIMVTFDGHVKLIDFGVAHAEVDDFRTAPGVLVGTLKFLSPEQALGTAIDARSDLYSLGAVMYEMLTGRSVVTGGKALIEALQEIVSAEPRPVRDFNPSVPAPVVSVLATALAKAPEARFDSADQMAAALLGAGGPAAEPEALGKLVQNLFPELATRMTGLRQRAQDSLTPLPRDGSIVDPFSATAVGPAPGEADTPTRAGRPDELEPPMERTRAEVWTELQEARTSGGALLPTRLLDDGALEAPARPFVSETTLPPPPSSSSSHLEPAPRRGLVGLALVTAALAVVALAGVTTLQQQRADEIVASPIQAPAPAPKAAPSAAPRVEAMAPEPRPAPRAARKVRRPPPPPRPARAKPPPAAAAERRPAARRPRRAPPRDALQAKLTRLSEAVDRGGAVDLDALSAVVDAVAKRAARAGDPDAQRQARRARDCLASCPTQERMLARAKAALAAVRAAERR